VPRPSSVLRWTGLVAVAVVAAGVVAAGCGAQGGDQAAADLQKGKELFVQGPGGGKPPCGSCHTLADAGTMSNVGPNLDEAFERSRDEGFDDSSIYRITLEQIDLAAPPMPSDIVTGDDARDVAAYVASVAANPQQAGGGGGTTGETTTTTP
jgi:mono/diheme cytochrome c family protein